MRRPSLDGDLARKELSPAYPMFYAQVSHKIRNTEIYIGCENIGNYMQHDPILNPDNPFSPAFNSSSVWGPDGTKVLHRTSNEHILINHIGGRAPQTTCMTLSPLFRFYLPESPSFEGT